MYSIEAAVAEIGAAHDGIMTAGLADKHGVCADARSRLRRRGVLVPLGRGVDRLRDHPFTWRSQCRAALELAGDGSVLGLRSAARLHRFYRYRSSEAVEVLAPRAYDSRLAFGRIVRTRWLPPEHVTEIEGFPVTTMARTFFDLCANPDVGLTYGHPYHERQMSQVYNDALARRGMTFTQEAAVLLVLAKRGRRGTTLTRKLLLRFGPTYRPTRSDTETLFLDLVHTYGLPDPERQAVITGVEGFIGTVDFGWRAAKLLVEVDSSWHDGPLDREADERRDFLLRAAGYEVKRYRYGRIVGDPGGIYRELGVILRRN